MTFNRSGAALVLAGHLALAWLVVLHAGPQADARVPTALLVRLHDAVSTPTTAAPDQVPPARLRVPPRATAAAPIVSPAVESAPAVPAVAEAATAVDAATESITALAVAPPTDPAVSPSPAPTAISEPLLIARPDHAYSPPPPHPPALLERGIGGVVWLRVLVERDGRAAEVQLLRGSGQRLLDESALDAVRRWRFVAARHGPQSLASWVEFPIRFTVRDPDQRAAL